MTGHLQPSELPDIATRMTNGSIVDLPGSEMHHVSPISQSQHLLPQPFTNVSTNNEIAHNSTANVFWPGIPEFKADRDFFTRVGDTTNGKRECQVVGEQRCIPNSQLMLTCSTGI